ncbi:uncharacterized protein LOC144637743 [Oculina patagonica]
MGNCFSGCTESHDSASSSGREKNAKGKRRFKLTRRNNSKASQKNSPTSTPRDDLSVTSVKSFDAGTAGTKSERLIIGRALPILEKTGNPGTEPGASNARIIVVQPSATSENSSEETFHGEGIKRPITGSESNASLSSFEEPKSNDDLEELSLDEESSATLPPRRESEEQEISERRRYLQLLEYLKIRLEIAANNMEINRLDLAFDRAAQIRELGFRRMRAAEEARRASRDIQEETGTALSSGEETEDEEDDESDEGGGTPPPPIPRVCWQ